jgi:hypothetical protein
MKILVNCCYGGFGFSDFGVAKLKENNLMNSNSDLDLRINPEVIKLAEKYGDELFDKHSDVEIEKLPDNITDYDINEYDGLETVIYVLDGKIYYL